MVHRSIDMIRRDLALKTDPQYLGRKVIEGIFVQEGQKVTIPLIVGNPIKEDDLLPDENMDLIFHITLVWDDYTAYYTNYENMGGTNNDLDVVVTRTLPDKPRKCYLPYIQHPNLAYPRMWDCSHHPGSKTITVSKDDWESFWQKVVINDNVTFDETYRENRNPSDNVEVVPVKLGDWTQDKFEVTIFCRELISSWQTFSVVVDYFENPVYPPEIPYDYHTSKSGYQCEIPDNDYWESRVCASDTQLWNYPAPKGGFGESNRSNYPRGVGRIFRTGKVIEKSDEIYFAPTQDSPAVVFNNSQETTVAMITKDGSLYLKGRLIASKPILQNDKEELPPNVDVGAKSIYKHVYYDPEEESYVTEWFDGPGDWLLEPLPEATPIPTSTPIQQNPQNKEWILKDSSGNIIMMLDYQTGNIRISGEYKSWNDSVLNNQDIRKFIIRISSDEGSAILMVDQWGNLYMKGALFEKVL